MRSAYIKARDAFQLADKFYKRAQDLLAHKAIAEADLEQAESNRAQARGRLAIQRAGHSRPGDRQSRKYPDRSSRRGIAACWRPWRARWWSGCARLGNCFRPAATQCFTLSDMNSVWVLVNVYQNDIANVHVGEDVTIENETYPGVVHGKIQYVAPSLDPTTRTLQARIEASNPGERLKKDMYVTAEVRAGVVPNALLVPDAAVLRDADNMPYVYIQTGNAQFARRMVSVGENRREKRK